MARQGACGLCIDAIAARAGVCRRLAQAAIRLAEGDGLLTIQERRHQGRKSDPNVLRIISREWQAWMRRARGQQPKGGGCKSLHPTDKGVLTPGTSSPAAPAKKLPERQGRLEDSGSRQRTRVAEAAKAIP